MTTPGNKGWDTALQLQQVRDVWKSAQITFTGTVLLMPPSPSASAEQPCSATSARQQQHPCWAASGSVMKGGNGISPSGGHRPPSPLRLLAARAGKDGHHGGKGAATSCSGASSAPDPAAPQAVQALPREASKAAPRSCNRRQPPGEGPGPGPVQAAGRPPPRLPWSP